VEVLGSSHEKGDIGVHVSDFAFGGIPEKTVA